MSETMTKIDVDGRAVAHLISAAPALLEACEVALGLLEAIANRMGGQTSAAGLETRNARAQLQTAIAIAKATCK